MNPPPDRTPHLDEAVIPLSLLRKRYIPAHRSGIRLRRAARRS